ncbi:abhydrolase domain-containing protein 1/3 [Fistulifera solaris]|uniref:Abhydrolase domain-containing protein 1/3 n=1 Tax=Fistulifera solaris TaxID=1519565 RepID=A0A1Z5K3W8_FISSO|nr:abhydrolase domain-containing protein 1/3 [Fistulifera solaris]|eukprot:GAX20771.1 abhydrolase domain-containing protein 1/3 [Fistulifera solaris]
MDVSDECSWKKVKMPRSGDKGTLSKSSSDGEENEEERMIQPTTTTCRSQKLETIVHRTSSLLQENLPQTKNGWTALLSSLGAILLGYEVHLQTQLSRAPRVYGQIADGPMNDIYHQMASSHDSLLHKPFRPKLFIGTRAAVASTASYLFPGPTTEYVEFREIVQMTMDGATVAIDWELPVKETVDRGDTEYWINTIRHGPISQPIVLVMHGMNNHSNYGYVRSMKRACCKRGWIAAGVNMRGCGGVALTTPRTYSGAFTADLRCVVQRLSARLAPNTPMFLVGNSLSANLVCKYLGEEGLCGTLPSCVAGGAALGNPMWMQTANTDFIMSPVLALGQKKVLLENWASLCQNNEPYFKSCVRRAMRALTLLEFDEAMAPVMARNDPVYPFAFRVGYKDAKSLRNDASSFRLARFISVPFLQLVAEDDFLVYNTFKSKLVYSISNPNVLVMETKCGGHLGWQQAILPGQSSSWADEATTDFIGAAFDAFPRLRPNHCQVDSSYFSTSDDRTRFSAQPVPIRSKL